MKQRKIKLLASAIALLSVSVSIWANEPTLAKLKPGSDPKFYRDVPNFGQKGYAMDKFKIDEHGEIK